MNFTDLTPEAIAERVRAMSAGELITALIDAMETLREADRKIALLEAEALASVNELCDVKGRYMDANRRAINYYNALKAIVAFAQDGLKP